MRYAYQVPLPKAVVISDEDVTALVALAQNKVGEGSSLSWALSSPLNEIDGTSLDELDETFRNATRVPSGLKVKAFRESSGTSDYDRTSISLDLTTKDPHFEVVSQDGAWAASATRELRAAITERGLASPLVGRNWFTGSGVVLGAALVVVGVALSAPGPGTTRVYDTVDTTLVAAGMAAVAAAFVLRQGPGQARLTLRGLAKPGWYDGGFVKGVIATVTLLGGAWLLYQVVSGALNRPATP